MKINYEHLSEQYEELPQKSAIHKRELPGMEPTVYTPPQKKLNGRRKARKFKEKMRDA